MITELKKIGYKIREARLERAPYMVIVGQNEEEDSTVSVRSREKGDEGSIALDDFVSRLAEEVESKYIYHQHIVEEDKKIECNAVVYTM